MYRPAMVSTEMHRVARCRNYVDDELDVLAQELFEWLLSNDLFSYHEQVNVMYDIVHDAVSSSRLLTSWGLRDLTSLYIQVSALVKLPLANETLLELEQYRSLITDALFSVYV